jgi:hypothetical protein
MIKIRLGRRFREGVETSFTPPTISHVSANSGPFPPSPTRRTRNASHLRVLATPRVTGDDCRFWEPIDLMNIVESQGK